MPMYEYQCKTCGEITETIRPIEARHLAQVCEQCGDHCDFLVSRPTVYIWNDERPFDNIAEKPVAFPTEKAYQAHLDTNFMREVAIDGKMKNPAGSAAEVTTYGGDNPEPSGPAGDPTCRGRWGRT